MKNTNVNIYFRIMGDYFNVDEITSKLDITPTKTWSIGDDIRNTNKKHLYTCWLYSTGKEETYDINTQLLKLEQLFFPKIDILCKLREQLLLDFSIDIVVVIENDEPPAIYLDNPIINFASKLNAKFDIDTYIN